MIVRVLQAGDSKSQGEIVVLPGIGTCQIVDSAVLTTAAQLTTWLSEARSAAGSSTVLVLPRLAHVVQSPDTHVYLALDGSDNVTAQITAT